MIRSILIVMTVLFSLIAAFAQEKPDRQTFDIKKLNDLFDVLESNDKMMGVVTITKDGRTIYNRALGYSRISGAKKLRNNGETKFPVASLTKTFTAVMIFQLIEEKKLALDTKLSKFFPQIANSEKITIEQMLTHRSGIHNYSLDADYQEWKTKPHSKKEILARFASYKPAFEPDEKEGYSNTAYILLGYLIEDLTKSSYGEQLNKRIINKLGLRNTVLDENLRLSNNTAVSYSFAAGSWHPVTKRTMASVTAAAGGIVSTTADINQFLSALFDKKLIGAKSLEMMITPPAATGNDTAKGIARIAFNNKTKIGYTYDGSLDAFGSVYFYVPEDRLGVVMTTNGQKYPFGEIFWLVIRILYGAPAPIPSFKTLALPDETLAQYEGTFALEGTDLKIVFKKENGKLTAQLTGEPAISLEPTGETKFQFAPDGVLIEFQKNEAGKIFQVSYYKDRQKTFWKKAR